MGGPDGPHPTDADPARGLTRPLAGRFFEGYRPGLTVEHGMYRVTSAEFIDFGRRFDPHDMHTAPVRSGPRPPRWGSWSPAAGTPPR